MTDRQTDGTDRSSEQKGHKLWPNLYNLGITCGLLRVTTEPFGRAQAVPRDLRAIRACPGNFLGTPKRFRGWQFFF